MTELDDFRTRMLTRQAEAEEAIVHGDAEPRMALWSRRDPVTLFGAAGMSESGWEALSEIFRWIASRFSEVSDFRFDVETAGVSGDMAYSVESSVRRPKLTSRTPTAWSRRARRAPAPPRP